MSAPEGAVTYTLLWTAPNEASKVLLCETPHGTCVLKRWMRNRVDIGGNRSQPLAEYAALLDLQDLPHINAPLKIILDKHGVDFIYANCGQNAMQWRKQLVHEDDEHKDLVAESLAQHVAVHAIKALQQLHARGYVHRDVKPSNILLRDYPHGGIWLSDMGLLTKSQQLSGFVKGLDLNYLPPEYITQSRSVPEQWQVIDDLVLLSSLTTVAVDMYQLGVSIFQLVTGTLPQALQPPKSSTPNRFSAFLQRVATFNWDREVRRCINNNDIAQLLNALLLRDPASRPEPSEALRIFRWLWDEFSPASGKCTVVSHKLADASQSWATFASSTSTSSTQHVQQEAAWASEQQQALRAANYIEYLRLQEELTAEPQHGPVAGTSAITAGGAWSAGYSGLGRAGSYDSAPSRYDSCGTNWYVSPYASPEALQPTVCAEDSFGDVATMLNPAAKVTPEDSWPSGTAAGSSQQTRKVTSSTTWSSSVHGHGQSAWGRGSLPSPQAPAAAGLSQFQKHSSSGWDHAE